VNKKMSEQSRIKAYKKATATADEAYQKAIATADKKRQ